MVPLHNLLPGHHVASDAATDQHGNDLGVFQPALSGTPGLSPGRWTSPGTSRDLTPQYKYVFVGPKVLCFCKARHCSRRGELAANVRRTCEVCIRLREIKDQSVVNRSLDPRVCP